MIWKSSKGNLKLSEMSDEHLENCINYILDNNRPKDLIFGFYAKSWIIAMGNELSNRDIAECKNEIISLLEENERIHRKYTEKMNHLSKLKEEKKTWNAFKHANWI